MGNNITQGAIWELIAGFAFAMHPFLCLQEILFHQGDPLLLVLLGVLFTIYQGPGTGVVFFVIIKKKEGRT